MTKIHSSLVVILLAIIAGVLLFGAETVKGYLWVLVIAAAVFAFIIIIIFSFVAAEKEREETGTGWWLFPMLIAMVIAIGISAWALIQSYRNGQTFYATLENYPMYLYSFGALFVVAMFVRLIEGRRLISILLQRIAYLLLAPFFVIQGAAARIAEKRRNGEIISTTSALFSILSSFLFSILLFLIGALAIIIAWSIIWTVLNPS